MLKKIEHVAVMASDFEKAIEFYTKYLGFEVFRRIENRLVFLKLGDSLLEIEPVNYSSYQHIGVNHFSLLAENIDEEVRKLEKLGIKFIINPTKDHKFAAFTGPDGVIIELIER